MRRSFLALAVTASLVTSQPSLLGQLWDLLAAVWSEPAADAGCIFDPSGRCTPAPRSDAGCIFDPNGRCTTAPPPESDAGCIFDPDGAPCRPGS